MRSLYKSAVFPLLARYDAEDTHNRTLYVLEVAQKLKIGRWLLRRIAGPLPAKNVELFGINFPNQLGVAAGFDKDARVVPGLIYLGFGHVEVGTITPHPQEGNPRPRIFRLTRDRALINRMGFPSMGAAYVASNLRKVKKSLPGCIVGASIGRQKATSIRQSANDYLYVMEKIYPYADYIALNISSPNTPGLRDLQFGEHLKRLLGAITKYNHVLAKREGRDKTPIVVKRSPDLSRRDLEELLDVSQSLGIDGIIATNTTIARGSVDNSVANEPGGLSGLPLAKQSDSIIKSISSYTDRQLPIIGAGGVFSASDTVAKLTAGASIVQLYTGIVYEGPGIAGRIIRALAA